MVGISDTLIHVCGWQGGKGARAKLRVAEQLAMKVGSTGVLYTIMLKVLCLVELLEYCVYITAGWYGMIQFGMALYLIFAIIYVPYCIELYQSEYCTSVNTVSQVLVFWIHIVCCM